MSCCPSKRSPSASSSKDARLLMSGVDLVAFSTSNKVDWWMVAKQSYLSLLHLTFMQLSHGCVNVDDLCLNVHLLACDTVLHGRLEAESTKALHPKQPKPFPLLTRALPGSEIGPAGWCSSCRKPLRPTRRDCHTHGWLHSVPRAAPSHLHHMWYLCTKPPRKNGLKYKSHLFIFIP